MSNNITSEHEQFFASNNFTVKILNNTKHSLFLKEKKLEGEGYWGVQPPNIIKPYTDAYFVNTKTVTSKIKGRVTYLISEGSFEIFWSRNFISGDVNYNVSPFDPQNEYDVTATSGPEMLTVNILETK